MIEREKTNDKECALTLYDAQGEPVWVMDESISLTYMSGGLYEFSLTLLATDALKAEFAAQITKPCRRERKG